MSSPVKHMQYKQKAKRFFSVLLPIFVTQVALTATGFFDTVMSGHVSEQDLAGVAVGSNLFMPFFGSFLGIISVLTPTIAQLHGAGRQERIGFVVRQGFYWSLGLAGAFLLLGIFFVPTILDFLALEPKVERVAAGYLAAIAFGIVPIFLAGVLRNLIDAHGYTRLTMVITLVTVPINVLANYIFMYGTLGIPAFGGIGAGIYAFLNRLLIPTGLHHALNNVFWFDTIGLGDLSHFWAGETSADVGWSLGMYMSGFFPCMMFGVLGAALAMVKTAKNKKAAIGLVLSAAICAFVCGVTEPFEFGFMFLCFPLYVVYSALYGIFTIITYYSGFRAGFCFSAGATDLVFSASLPAAAKTWMIIPLGIAAFVVFYAVFYFAITKFDLKTPGREDEDEEAEKKVVLANNNYTEVASAVLAAIGGKENVKEVGYCATRLRFEVKDNAKVDEKAVKAAGAAGVIRPSKNACQVIIGTKVQFVYDELKKML